MNSAIAMAKPQPKKSVLGIIAGDGRLPALLIEACQRGKRDVFVLAFEDSTDMNALKNTPHALVRLGALGEALNTLRKHGVEQLVMAGKVSRPSLSTLKPDRTAAKLLTRLGAAFFSGDNALFKSIVAFLEEEGFHVIGSEDVLREIIAPEGVLGKHQPDNTALADILQGIKIAKTLGENDIGQAAIVQKGKVLGVEDSLGTDALIARCALVPHEQRSGVLVKVKKPDQETRVDLPAIGPQTVQNVYDAGFIGIAVEAGGSIIIDRGQVIELADKLGVFIMGVHE